MSKPLVDILDNLTYPQNRALEYASDMFRVMINLEVIEEEYPGNSWGDNITKAGAIAVDLLGGVFGLDHAQRLGELSVERKEWNVWTLLRHRILELKQDG